MHEELSIKDHTQNLEIATASKPSMQNRERFLGSIDSDSVCASPLMQLVLGPLHIRKNTKLNLSDVIARVLLVDAPTIQIVSERRLCKSSLTNR